MLSRCGIQFEFVYVKKEYEPPGIDLLVGRSTHKSVASDMTSKLKNKTLLSLEEICDQARDTLIREWDSGEIRLEVDEALWGIKRAKANAIDKTVRLSTLHHIELAPHLNPTHVEREWALDLRGCPVNLAGAIDLQEGSEWIRDTKTSAKTPGEDIAEQSLQLTTYSFASFILDKTLVKNLSLDYLIDKKVPAKKIFKTTRDEEDFRVLFVRIEAAVKALEKGVFIPARQLDWWCSSRFCGFFHKCRYVRRPKQF